MALEAQGLNLGGGEGRLQAGQGQGASDHLAGGRQAGLLVQPPAPAGADHPIAVGGGVLVDDPAAEFRRQAAGEAPAQALVIQQHQGEALLAQHQPPRLIEQVAGEVGAVGQGLAGRGKDRQGVLQGWIAQGHIHLGPEASPGASAAGAAQAAAAGQFPHQQGAPIGEQAGQGGEGIERLAV